MPYRDSALTKVLADSLGGNCKTVMIANVSCDFTELDDAVATCRFAQRVACIKQTATVNEELDSAAVIADLKTRLETMKVMCPSKPKSHRTCCLRPLP